MSRNGGGLHSTPPLSFDYQERVVGSGGDGGIAPLYRSYPETASHKCSSIVVEDIALRQTIIFDPIQQCGAMLPTPSRVTYPIITTSPAQVINRFVLSSRTVLLNGRVLHKNHKWLKRSRNCHFMLSRSRLMQVRSINCAESISHSSPNGSS